MIASIAAVAKEQLVLVGGIRAAHAHLALGAAPRNRALLDLVVVELEVERLLLRRLVERWNVRHLGANVDTIVQLVDAHERPRCEVQARHGMEELAALEASNQHHLVVVLWPRSIARILSLCSGKY